MNHFFSEELAELNRRQLIEESNELRLQRDLIRRHQPLRKSLAILGDWLIDLGKKLQARNSDSKQEASFVDLLKRTA